MSELEAPSHDTPNLEQRVAALESIVTEMERGLEAVKNVVKDRVLGRPPGTRQCPNVMCQRRINVPVGAPCPICGKKT